MCYIKDNDGNTLQTDSRYSGLQLHFKIIMGFKHQTVLCLDGGLTIIIIDCFESWKEREQRQSRRVRYLQHL